MSSVADTPYLERFPEQGGPSERIPVLKLPLTLGRAESADYTVYSGPISKKHAAIVRIGDRYGVRDLHSTNGTFVNGQRVSEQALEDGDIIHLANVEFRFRNPSVGNSLGTRDVERTQVVSVAQPDSRIRGAELLEELMRTEAVEILYQPIVELKTRAIIGYEALARGTHPQLNRLPTALLSLAEQCGMVVELSQLFRRLAVLHGRALPHGAKLFLNVHARELDDDNFMETLAVLPVRTAAEQPIVIEIAESSVTDVSTMASHRDALVKLGFELAYDDFGAGQARLIELTDVPPAYLKLDRGLVHGIEAPARQQMIRALLNVTEALGVRVIAECIEGERAARTLERLGCGFGQGYWFSPAVPLPVVTALHKAAVERALPAARPVERKTGPARRLQRADRHLQRRSVGSAGPARRARRG